MSSNKPAPSDCIEKPQGKCGIFCRDSPLERPSEIIVLIFKQVDQLGLGGPVDFLCCFFCELKEVAQMIIVNA